MQSAMDFDALSTQPFALSPAIRYVAVGRGQDGGCESAPASPTLIG
jgi:hypothetical protein